MKKEYIVLFSVLGAIVVASAVIILFFKTEVKHVDVNGVAKPKYLGNLKWEREVNDRVLKALADSDFSKIKDISKKKLRGDEPFLARIENVIIIMRHEKHVDIGVEAIIHGRILNTKIPDKSKLIILFGWEDKEPKRLPGKNGDFVYTVPVKDYKKPWLSVQKEILYVMSGLIE